jgi:hypothetical protein
MAVPGVIQVEVLTPGGGASQQFDYEVERSLPIGELLQHLEGQVGGGTLRYAGQHGIPGRILLAGSGIGVVPGNYVYSVLATPGGIGSCLLQHFELLVLWKGLLHSTG